MAGWILRILGTMLFTMLSLLDASGIIHAVPVTGPTTERHSP